MYIHATHLEPPCVQLQTEPEWYELHLKGEGGDEDYRIESLFHPSLSRVELVYYTPTNTHARTHARTHTHTHTHTYINTL